MTIIRFSAAVTSLFIALTSQAQYHWSPVGPTPVLSAPDAGVPSGDPLTNATMRTDSRYYLTYNVYWNNDGTAFLTGTWKNGYISNFTVGAGVSSSYTSSIEYELSLVSQGNSEYIVVLIWSKETLAGGRTRGTIPIGRIRRGSPGYMSPVGNGPASGAHYHTRPSTMTDGGRYVTVESYQEIAFMGFDGVYYVIGTTHHTTFWLPSLLLPPGIPD